MAPGTATAKPGAVGTAFPDGTGPPLAPCPAVNHDRARRGARGPALVTGGVRSCEVSVEGDPMDTVTRVQASRLEREWAAMPASPPAGIGPVTTPRGKPGMAKLRRAFRGALGRVGARWDWGPSTADPIVVPLAESWRHSATPTDAQADEAVGPFVGRLESLFGAQRDRRAVRSVSEMVGMPVTPDAVDDGMCLAYGEGRNGDLGLLLAAAHGVGRPPGPLDVTRLAAAAAAGERPALAAMDIAIRGAGGGEGGRPLDILLGSGLDPAAAQALVDAVEGLRGRGGHAAGEGRSPSVPKVSDAELARRRALAARVCLEVTRRRVVLPPVPVAPAASGPRFEPFAVRASMPWPAEALASDAAGVTEDGRAATLATLVSVRAGEVAARLASAVGDGASILRGIASPDLLDLHLSRAMAALSPDGKKLDDDRLVGSFARAIRNAHDAVATAAARDGAAADLKRRTGLADYAALFPVARAMRRRVVFHVGPTNSGKTHAAMSDLSAAPTGAYLAPLRLMAMEAWDRLNAAGVPTTLSTGEERVEAAGDTHVASTVEMADLSRPVDVAVVDEVQLLLDEDRGWAWTQALFGMPARVLHLAGSDDAFGHVARVAALLGEVVEVVRHDRLVPLVAVERPVAEVMPGDAVVAFTRADVLRLRASLSRTHRVATIYGALSPEVRRAEAARFRSGAADVLVATDAIGLGLNLPIRRVLFSTLEKYDGRSRRPLTASEIRQVAGRAGRFGLAEAGEAGLLAVESGGRGGAPGLVAQALAGRPVAPDAPRLPVMPPWQAVEAVSAELGTADLAKILAHLRDNVLGDDPLLRPADLTDSLRIAGLVANSGLPLDLRHRYLGCPVDDKAVGATRDIREWSLAHGAGQWVHPPSCHVVATPGLGQPPPGMRIVHQAPDGLFVARPPLSRPPMSGVPLPRVRGVGSTV